MEEIVSKLKNIGLHEVSRKTHISQNKVEAILEKDFASLDRTSTVGFVKILEREYGLDFSEWMEEYQQYCEAHSDSEVSEKTFLVSGEDSPNEESSSFWVILVVVAILAGGIYYLKDHVSLEAIQGAVGMEQSDSPEMTMPDAAQEDITIDAEDQVLANMPAVQPIPEVDIVDENISGISETGEVAEESNQTISASEPKAIATPVEVESGLVSTVALSPRTRVWVGQIDLVTRQKKDYTTEEAIDLNLTHPFLLVTGHGDLDLSIDANQTYLRQENPVRFHYDGRRFTIITIDEFRELNQGVLW